MSGTSCGPVSLLLLNSGILTAKDFLIVSAVELVMSVHPQEARRLCRRVAKAVLGF